VIGIAQACIRIG